MVVVQGEEGGRGMQKYVMVALADREVTYREPKKGPLRLPTRKQEAVNPFFLLLTMKQVEESTLVSGLS
jgi:hypothetical protein